MHLKPMICIPIFQNDLDSALKSANTAIKLGADILELRIDALKDPDPQSIKTWMNSLNCRIIATNRMLKEGGSFRGSESDRTEILVEIAEHADFVDIELQTENKYRSKVIRAAKSSIVSFHDFEKTPSVEELLMIVSQERKLGDVAKFAVMPRNMQDTLTVLEVLSQVKNTIGISMGDLGRYTRVVAGLFGSPLTFASLDIGSAPGQLDIETTRKFMDKFGDGGDKF